MADREVKIGRMVAVSILVVLFICVVSFGAAATATKQIAPELTSGSRQQQRQKDHPSLPPFCQYIEKCLESNCNSPKVCGMFYQHSVCCDP